MKELVRLWPSVCHCWRTSVVLCLVRFGTLACHDSFIYPLIYPPLCVLPMIAHGLFILTWSWGSWLVLCCWGAGKRALHVSPLSFRCNKPVITMSRPWGYHGFYIFIYIYCLHLCRQTFVCIVCCTAAPVSEEWCHFLLPGAWNDQNLKRMWLVCVTHVNIWL